MLRNQFLKSGSSLNRICSKSVWTKSKMTANGIYYHNRLSINRNPQRCFSSAIAAQKLNIYFGSQTGTARMFAEELGDAANGLSIENEIIDLVNFKPETVQKGEDAVFLVACYGQGEPTDNAKEFYKWIMEKDSSETQKPLAKSRYAVFGLGNKSTHCDRFCVVGINVDKRMEEMGAHRMFDRVDGDDSDCIEIQFDEWQSEFLKKYKEEYENSASSPSSTPPPPPPAETAAVPPVSSPNPSSSSAANNKFAATAKVKGTCSTATELDESDVVIITEQPDALNQLPDYWAYLAPRHFRAETCVYRVLSNKELTPYSRRSMKELLIEARPVYPKGRAAVEYDTGDHFVVYPQNQSSDVVALLERIDLSSINNNPDALLPTHLQPRDNAVPAQESSNSGQGSSEIEKVPTVREYLQYVLDIRSIASPKLIRNLAELCPNEEERNRLLSLAAKENYKQKVAEVSRTLFDLLCEFPSLKIDLDQLIKLTPLLHPRFYSISSSAQASPKAIGITYRVLEYPSVLNSRPRFGICSKFLSDLIPTPSLPSAALPSTPTHRWLPGYVWKSSFKLPNHDPSASVIMIGGGTGIAPFKGFIDERAYLRENQPDKEWGAMALYYGVLNETEYAYRPDIEQALKNGVLSRLFVPFSQAQAGEKGIMLSDCVAADADYIFQELQKENTHLYVCGGAHGFGPSIVNVIKDKVLKEAGNMTSSEAEEYFRMLIAKGRYLEDLG